MHFHSKMPVMVFPLLWVAIQALKAQSNGGHEDSKHQPTPNLPGANIVDVVLQREVPAFNSISVQQRLGSQEPSPFLTTDRRKKDQHRQDQQLHLEGRGKELMCLLPKRNRTGRKDIRGKRGLIWQRNSRWTQ